MNESTHTSTALERRLSVIRSPAASLALRFRNLFLGADAPAPRAWTSEDFLASTVLFSDIRCAGDQWPSGDRAAELGGRWQQHRLGTTVAVSSLHPFTYSCEISSARVRPRRRAGLSLAAAPATAGRRGRSRCRRRRRATGSEFDRPLARPRPTLLPGSARH